MINISKYICYPGTNIVEVIHYKENKDNIIKFVKGKKGEMFNPTTGDVIEYCPSSTKDQCLESTRITLLHASELIKYNFLRYDTVYSVELTFRDAPRNYNEFQTSLRNFTRRMRRYDKDIKYIIIKEAGSDGKFHAHAIIWSPELTEEIIRQKWKYGDQVNFAEIHEKKDLIFKTSYLTNITGDSDKAKEKKENLIYFPANKHLYLPSKNLEEPKFIKGVPNVKVKETILETPESKIIEFGTKYHTFEAA